MTLFSYHNSYRRFEPYFKVHICVRDPYFRHIISKSVYVFNILFLPISTDMAAIRTPPLSITVFQQDPQGFGLGLQSDVLILMDKPFSKKGELFNIVNSIFFIGTGVIRTQPSSISTRPQGFGLGLSGHVLILMNKPF